MSHARCAGLLFLVLVGCFEQNDALTPSLVQNADLLERDVYVAAIPYVMGREPAALDVLDSNIFWLDHWADTVLMILADSLSPSDREVIADFRRRNPGPGSVEVPLHMRDEYRWIRPSDVNPYHRITDGRILVGISHVGFSHDYRNAVLYITYNCGFLCGAGNFVWLERDAASLWHVTQERLAWVS